ncbi:MAG: EAL domain-containing protein [Lachnospiraceae bacterium]|nr:EAL domain-containing protein [Lachnospiraceae bacterium]
MVNIYFDGCAVAAIATLVLALIVRKLTKGRNNALFLCFCVIILLLSFADRKSLSYERIPNIPIFLEINRYVFKYAYFLLLGIVIPTFFLYLCSYIGIWHKIKDVESMFLWWAVPLGGYLIILLQNMFTGNLFYIDDSEKYVETSYISIFYLIFFYFLILCFVTIIRYRHLLGRIKSIALGLLVLMNAFALYIQVMSEWFRISSFALAIMAISIAIMIQRPEEMMDYVVGLQNYNAFLHTVRTNFSSGAPKIYLFIRFVNSRSLRSSLGLDNYLVLLENISGKIERMCRISGLRSDNFYLNIGAFAIAGDVDMYEHILDAGRVIAAYLLEPIKIKQMEVMLDARVCLVHCPDDISNEASLLNFANSFHTKLPDERRVIVLSKIAKTKDFKVRSEMDMIISRGIQNRNFEMYYQPIYSIKEDKFVSAEALIRLNDEVYGFVSPALFIPAAEQSGAIHEIGDYVIEDVCRFVGSEEFRNSGLEYVEINLSVAQCIEADLFEKIDAYMKKYGVEPHQINLEITETAVDYDPETTDKNIDKLSQAGIPFSLDDYGTGYSNIKRVVSLPLSIVKLDKTLVDEMDTPLMWIVISNTVRMLKRMNKKILVEGIEDKRALIRFMEIGCDYIQGFYFSKPLPKNEFLDFLTKNN